MSKTQFERQVGEFTTQIDAKKATCKGVRVESNRTEDQIQGLIRKFQLRIRGIESHNENIEEVEHLLRDKTDQMNRMVAIQSSFNAVMAKVSSKLKLKSKL